MSNSTFKLISERKKEEEKKKKKETLLGHWSLANRTDFGVRHALDTDSSPKMPCRCNLDLNTHYNLCVQACVCFSHKICQRWVMLKV